MLFHDPDTLQFWINLFFTVAAASVVFAFAALAVGIRDLRRPAVATVAPVPTRQLGDVKSQPTHRAA